MVEVKEFSADKTMELYGKYGISYFEDISKAIGAFDNEKVLGTCLYDITDTVVTVRLINPDADLTMADSMLRSALFIAANRGIMEACFTEPVTAKLIKRLGFLGNQERKAIDITNLFNPCGCK